MLSITSKNPNADGSVWTITNDSFSLITDWTTALDWLEGEILDGNLKIDSIIHAGPRGVPWFLDYYLEAAHAADALDQSGVFQAFGNSAASLVKEDEKYREPLTLPWQTDA